MLFYLIQSPHPLLIHIYTAAFLRRILTSCVVLQWLKLASPGLAHATATLLSCLNYKFLSTLTHFNPIWHTTPLLHQYIMCKFQPLH